MDISQYVVNYSLPCTWGDVKLIDALPKRNLFGKLYTHEEVAGHFFRTHNIEAYNNRESVPNLIELDFHLVIPWEIISRSQKGDMAAKLRQPFFELPSRFDIRFFPRKDIDEAKERLLGNPLEYLSVRGLIVTHAGIIVDYISDERVLSKFDDVYSCLK